jgi:Ni,Fe-hydrogenase III large subunit
MHLTLSDIEVRHVKLDPPSAHNLTLVDAIAREQEVGDALAGLASLDLSPWVLGQ